MHIYNIIRQGGKTMTLQWSRDVHIISRFVCLLIFFLVNYYIRFNSGRYCLIKINGKNFWSSYQFVCFFKKPTPKALLYRSLSLKCFRGIFENFSIIELVNRFLRNRHEVALFFYKSLYS